jgi:hypothetical protein
MTRMANPRTIDATQTMRLLLEALKEVALADGTPIPPGASPVEFANLYRAAHDPAVQRTDMAEPSSHKGVALARALGLLATHEIIAPSLRAMRQARIAAADAMDALARLCSANDELRRRGQKNSPLYGIQDPAVLVLVGLTAALPQIPESISILSDEDRHEALVMNVTRELESSFKPAEVAGLVDDGQGGTKRQRWDRARSRRRDLTAWTSPFTEAWFVPAGCKGPGGGS